MDKKMFQCAKCGKSFVRKFNLKRHINAASCRNTIIQPVASSSSSMDAAGPSPPKQAKQDTVHCPKCDVYVPKDKLAGHLRTLLHKNNHVSNVDSRVDCVQQAFKGKTVTFRIKNEDLNNISIQVFLQNAKECLFRLIEEHLKKLTSIKINVCLFGEYFQRKTLENDVIIKDVKSFNTKNEIIDRSTDLDDYFQRLVDVLVKKSQEFQERDSGKLLSIFFTRTCIF